VREQRVDAQAARRAGLQARRERIAAAKVRVDAATSEWIRADARHARLRSEDAPARELRRARQQLDGALDALRVARERLDDARAPRRRDLTIDRRVG
jgi:hypothetical protein